MSEIVKEVRQHVLVGAVVYICASALGKVLSKSKGNIIILHEIFGMPEAEMTLIQHTSLHQSP